MFSKLWLKSDDLRLGFVVNFKNGWKVVVEYLRCEKDSDSLNPIAEKKDLITGISWDTILNHMESTRDSCGDDIGFLFDIHVYNPLNKLVRSKKWAKGEKVGRGLFFEDVIDVLHIIKRKIQ